MNNREQNTVTIERRQDHETREAINSLLNSFQTKEAKFYWLNCLVKLGKVSRQRAGQILIENRII